MEQPPKKDIKAEEILINEPDEEVVNLEIPINEPEVPITTDNEGTPKEWREKLRGLVDKFTSVVEGGKEKVNTVFEKSKEYLTERRKELDEKIIESNGSKTEGIFRFIGENYNKLSTREKIGVGIALGLGAGGLATASVPAAFVFFGGIATQRVFGLASSFLKYEKSMQDGKWKKEKAMGKAVVYSAGMTLGMMALVEGVKEGTEWLSHHWPSNSADVVHAPAVSSVAPHENIVPPASHSIEPPPIMAEAEAGKGYEFMVKRLWEQLHDPANHFKLPANADPNSDIAKLFKADADSIDGVVHNIARDTQHGFFNADGTSVQIDTTDHLSFGTDGQIHLAGEASHSGFSVHAPENSPVTSTPHPEAPSAPVEKEPVAHVEKPAIPIKEPLPAPLVEKPIIPEEIPVSLPPEAPIPQTVESPQPSVEPPAPFVEPQAPPEITSNAEPFIPADELPAQSVEPAPSSVETYDAPSEHLSEQQVAQEIPKIEEPSAAPEIITNKFGLEIPKNVPHIYADEGAKHLFVYGGSPTERANMILKYLTDNPDKVVYGADANGENRIPWHLVEGKAVPEAPAQTRGFFGWIGSIFSGNSFIEAPKPDEFQKLIK